MTDIPTADKTVTFTFTECKDGDNNHYPVVQINTQLWMAENLAYLPVVHNNAEFQIQGNNSEAGYGVYGYNGSDLPTAKSQQNYTTYGVLYNWWAGMDGANSSEFKSKWCTRRLSDWLAFAK